MEIKHIKVLENVISRTWLMGCNVLWSPACVCVQTYAVEEAGWWPWITGFTWSISYDFCQAPLGQLSLPRRPQVSLKVIQLTHVQPVRRCSLLTVRQIEHLTEPRQRAGRRSRFWTPECTWAPRWGFERHLACSLAGTGSSSRFDSQQACLSDNPGWRFQQLVLCNIESWHICSRMLCVMCISCCLSTRSIHHWWWWFWQQPLLGDFSETKHATFCTRHAKEK